MKKPAKKWWIIAREEGRVCRLCNEPVGKSTWKDPIYDHLCIACFMRESDLPHSPHWQLGRR